MRGETDGPEVPPKGLQATCYRLSGAPGHYRIVDYDRTLSNPPGVCSCCGEAFQRQDGTSPTVALLHGADSSLPGIGVVGVSMSNLVPCNCGQWREATEAQLRASLARLRPPAAERHRTA